MLSNIVVNFEKLAPAVIFYVYILLWINTHIYYVFEFVIGIPVHCMSLCVYFILIPLLFQSVSIVSV